ncbi:MULTISPECIES: hypothetical protein [Streptomyces]|uniref:Uncharacterized protein n=1 Tax=Streptomyces chilikensis TaxID=1194079 RepID=A0ABV3ETV4_9ACTN|nr:MULTISPECIES: hypothetical protein [Streptomyces]MDH6224437.1 hypothetical protein [Streptomyces sp. MJP52]
MPDRKDEERGDKSHPLEQVTGERDVTPEEERSRQGDDRSSSTDEERND